MGTDIHVRILFKKNAIWKSVNLYRYDEEKDEFKKIDIYPFRNSELFDILNEEVGNSIEYNSLPVDLLKEKAIKDCKTTSEYYNFQEVNLADLKLYLLKNPKIRDYDYEAENDEDFNKNGWKTNPVEFFIERIEYILDLAEPYYDFSPPSYTRIIYWFDS